MEEVLLHTCPKNVAPRDHHDDNDDDDDDNDDDDDDNYDNGKLRHICSEGERSLVFLIRFQKSEIGEISEMIRTKRCCFLIFLLSTEIYGNFGDIQHLKHCPYLRSERIKTHLKEK